jgi:hypothetical protein
MALQQRVTIYPSDVATAKPSIVKVVRRRARTMPWVRFIFYRMLFPVPYTFAGIRHRGLVRPKRPTVLFVPEKPKPKTALYKICKVNRYRFANRPTAKADIVVRWEDVTVGKPIEPQPQWAGNARLVNFECRDISKCRLDEAHQEVFGYGVNVEPKTHVGTGVIKSDENAQHDGRIAQFPIEHIEDGVVYQRLIRNETGDGMVQDLRIPVIGSTLPFVYVRFRAVEHRFGKAGRTLAIMAPVDEYLSRQEQEQIVALAKRIGLDYGEFDVLRDVEDGRVYVVDANNTPISPTKYVSKSDHWKALAMMSDAFANAFGSESA